MAQELANGQVGRRRFALAGEGEPRQVLLDRVVEIELALVAKLHDGGGGEELGHGADAIARAGCRGDAPLDVGQAEAARPTYRGGPSAMRSTDESGMERAMVHGGTAMHRRLQRSTSRRRR